MLKVTFELQRRGAVLIEPAGRAVRTRSGSDAHGADTRDRARFAHNHAAADNNHSRTRTGDVHASRGQLRIRAAHGGRDAVHDDFVLPSGTGELSVTFRLAHISSFDSRTSWKSEPVDPTQLGTVEQGLLKEYAAITSALKEGKLPNVELKLILPTLAALDEQMLGVAISRLNGKTIKASFTDGRPKAACRRIWCRDRRRTGPMTTTCGTFPAGGPTSASAVC